MKTIFLVLSVVGIASVNAGFLNGGHFIPATNIVSSRTIVGSAIGGGPTSGAISTAQYSQTVPAPATVQTIITSHPGPSIGYPGAGTGGASGSGGPSQNNGGNNAGAYGNYVYNSGPGGSNTQGGSSASGGYGSTQGVSTGNGLNSGYGQSQTSYYNQRHY